MPDDQLDLPLPPTVTIPREDYQKLLRDSDLLAALDAAGVDGWDGYDFAIETFLDHTDQ